VEKGAAGVEVEEGDLEEGPGAKEEILRLLLVAEMAWACWTSAAQRQRCARGGAELCSGRSKTRRPRLGFGGVCGGEMRHRGVAGAFKEGPGILGRRAQERKPAKISGFRCARERGTRDEEGDEADRWGRPGQWRKRASPVRAERVERSGWERGADRAAWHGAGRRAAWAGGARAVKQGRSRR